MECKTEFMVVKIRFGNGPVVSRRRGKNKHLAMLAASLLTLGSISLAALGFWRLGEDLDWAGAFFVADGFLSHWQVWLGAAAALQYGAWKLTRYATVVPVPAPPDAQDAEIPTPGRKTADV